MGFIGPGPGPGPAPLIHLLFFSSMNRVCLYEESDDESGRVQLRDCDDGADDETETDFGDR